jgi:hypothetical protein
MSNSNDKALSFKEHDKGKGLNDKILKEDSLEISIFSQSLYEFIEVCETPMTIGIQGDWGMGKTSMMEMILARLKQTTKSNSRKMNYKTIWFNTWQYSMFQLDDYLGLTAITELLELIKDEMGVKDNSSEKWNKIKSIASSISVQFMGLSIDGKKLTEDNNEPYLSNLSKHIKDFKIEFEKLIKEECEENNVDKIVFFIDDLDRVRPIKALELLETMKNFFDVEKCVFVLAVDYEVVQTGMKEKFGIDFEKQSGKSFFDKIIQLPFVMPSSSYNLKKYVGELLRNVEGFDTQGKGIFSEQNLEYVEEIILLTVGTNPRSIKRVINYLMLISQLNRTPSHPTRDFNVQKFKGDQAIIAFTIVCMQVAWPEIFNYFLERPTPLRIRQIENWDTLDLIPDIQKLYNRNSNIDQLKSKISSFFDVFHEILDNDKRDGVIDAKEFEPVIEVLKLCRYIGEKDIKEPIDMYKEKVKEKEKNNEGKYTNFIENVYKRSQWHQSNKIKFEMSGHRYGTLIYNRKQIGTLVTLSNEPILFRINFDKEKLNTFKENKTGNEYNDDNMVDYIEDYAKEETTGWGNHKLKINDLLKLSPEEQIKYLNQILDLIEIQYK